MAVVFISPKKKQKMFLFGIAAFFGLFLMVIALWVFFSQPSPVPAGLVFNKPKITIDFTIFDSEQFEKLEAFEEMKTQYKYSAMTKEGKQVEGLISATSIQEATKSLEDMNFRVGSVKEVEIGRDNPFMPYVKAQPSQATENTTP